MESEAGLPPELVAEELEAYQREKIFEAQDEANRSLRALLGRREGREYVLRQLKRAFPLSGGSLCSNGEATYYNLGKFESYLEMLLDIREAYSGDPVSGRRYVAEILLGWFFDGGLGGEQVV